MSDLVSVAMELEPSLDSTVVYFEQERIDDIVPQKLEAWIPKQMSDVVLGACEQIVDTDDFGARRDQPVTEVTSEEASATGNNDSIAGHYAITGLFRHSEIQRWSSFAR